MAILPRSRFSFCENEIEILLPLRRLETVIKKQPHMNRLERFESDVDRVEFDIDRVKAGVESVEEGVDPGAKDKSRIQLEFSRDLGQ